MRYSFHAEDSYYGSQVEVSGFFLEQDAQNYIRALQGKAITIRYKPGNPDMSRAEPELPPKTFVSS
jgi:hypothetical protein